MEMGLIGPAFPLGSPSCVQGGLPQGMVSPRITWGYDEVTEGTEATVLSLPAFLHALPRAVLSGSALLNLFPFSLILLFLSP